MSVLVEATPSIYTGRHDLILIIAETLNNRFPNVSNPTPGRYDSEEELLYKIATIAGNIPSTGGAANFSGAGSPEGAQTGAVGSTYWDTTNSEFYVKNSGTGNTGWQVLIS